jgi:MFS family permease
MTAAMVKTDTSPEKPSSILSGPYRVATAGIVLVVTLLAFEAMAVGTVMPVTARELHGLSLYAWSFSAFLIASLPANVVAGGWADRVGPGKPLMTSLATFVGGLVIAGTAPQMWVFVAGRAVQGLGAGVAGVAIYVVVARVYPEALRPRVFAALSAAWVVPSLVGPAVAGFVAEHLHWRAVFLGLIPLVVPAMMMLIPSIRDSGGDAARTPRRGRVRAALALAGGAAALLFAVEHVRWPVLLVAAAGVAGLAFGLPRLLPAGSLTLRRGLPTVISTRGLLAGAFFGTEAFIPLALTSLHGFTPTRAGVTLTIGAIGWSIGSWYQGRARRPHQALVAIGSVLIALGVVGIAAGVPMNGWLAVPAWVVAGGGMGLAYSSLSVLTLNLSTPADQGVNSAALQISDTLGGALVIGAAGTLVTGFGTARLGLGLAVAGALTTVIAVFAVFAALRVSEGRQASPA